MNRIEARFNELAARHETAFIPFVTAGDPTLDATARIVLELERAGSDIVELGIPFSDPVADGIVNQEAAQRALKNNVTLHDVVELVRRLRQDTQIPILLFTYYNPVLAYGIPQLARDCKEAGIDGILCVDLPPGEDPDYKRCLDENGVSTIYLIAPTSPPERIRLIAENCTGFAYYVCRIGVTGERDGVDESVVDMVRAIQDCSKVPVAVGFGISTPEQATEIGGYAEGVVVGSAIVRMIGELGDAPDMPAQVGAFVKTLADATKATKTGAE